MAKRKVRARDRKSATSRVARAGWIRHMRRQRPQLRVSARQSTCQTRPDSPGDQAGLFRMPDGTAPEFTVDAAAFSDAVRRAARIAKDASHPLLRGVLITARHGHIAVSATDLETSGQATIDAGVDQVGRVVVEAGMLARICRYLPGPLVDVRVTGSHLRLDCGTASFRLLTMPAEDFPQMPSDARPMADFRPVGHSPEERRLAHGEKFQRDIRRGWRARRTAGLYEPAGMQPGAWIEWHRPGADDKPASTVRGQVWAAYGAKAVWALVEGERPVLVTERTYGTGSWAAGDYRTHTRLEEVSH